MKKNNIRLNGQLNLIMLWPAIATILLVGMNVWVYGIDVKSGMFMSVGVLIYGIVAITLYFYNKSRFLAEMVEFAAEYSIVQNKLLKELGVPYAILQADGRENLPKEPLWHVTGADMPRKCVKG